MTQDITLPAADGFVNVRVGAIIQKEGKVLMVGNDRVNYCYSVGGRIQFGECAEDAVRREVPKRGKLIYEIAFYFYMKTPADFEPRCDSFTEEGNGERLEWISPDTEKTIFPAFFRTELKSPVPYVRHILTDERI